LILQVVDVKPSHIVNVADTFEWRLGSAFLGVFDFDLVLGLQAL
jgi:hypothetical protein